MKKTGFGQAGEMTGMYSMNKDGSADKTSNVWPAQNTPVEYFGKNYPWSVSTGKEETGNVEVTLTNTKTKTHTIVMLVLAQLSVSQPYQWRPIQENCILTA
jgi:hypothetical protein